MQMQFHKKTLNGWALPVVFFVQVLLLISDDMEECVLHTRGVLLSLFEPH